MHRRRACRKRMEPRTRANAVRFLVALAGALLGAVIAFRWADSPSHSSLRELRGEGHHTVAFGSAMLGSIGGAALGLFVLGMARSRGK